MSFEIFSKLNQLIDLLPKFNVAIDTHSDDEVGFRGSYNIVDGFLVHEADFVEIRGRQSIEEQFVILD